MDGEEKHRRQREEGEEIDLVDLIKVLLKNKMLIAAVTAGVFLLSSIGAVLTRNSSKSAVAVIRYNYNGISNGKNPDGSLFSTNQIIDTVILNKVYRK